MTVKGIKNNQKGLASFVILGVLVIILSLITITFSLLSRREQRQALDRQLSTQAYYAAESGINDASAAIKAGFKGTKDQCQPFASPGPVNAETISGSTSNVLEAGIVEYSCLLIDTSPDTLSYGSVKPEQPIIVPIRPAANIAKIVIAWEAAEGSNAFRTGGVYDFPALGAWKNSSGENLTGVLRATLAPTSSLNRASLIANSRSFFLYPMNGGTRSDQATMANADDGSIFDGKCDSSRTPACKVEINVSLNGVAATDPPVAVLALKGYYFPVRAEVYALDGSNNLVDLLSVQSTVDSTGRANDVVRRIQVRIPTEEQYETFLGALVSTDSLCKRFLTAPPPSSTTANDPAGCSSL